jgi:hypothetical protein
MLLLMFSKSLKHINVLLLLVVLKSVLVTLKNVNSDITTVFNQIIILYDYDTTRWKLISVHKHSLKMALSWTETRQRKENYA